MRHFLKTNTKIVMALAVTTALLPLTFKLNQQGFQNMLLLNKPIMSGVLAFVSVILTIKTNTYFSQKQRMGLCLFFLLLPFTFLYPTEGFTFVLIQFQPAIALGYFGVGLALFFNALKIHQTTNKA